MKGNRFAIAAHILTCIEYNSRRGEPLSSSAAIATSVKTNPVYVRELVCALRAAKLVVTKEGSGGGIQLARPASSITLDEVYAAVEEGPVLKQNCRPTHKPCPVSCGIHAALEPVVDGVQVAILQVLSQRKVSDLVNKIEASK
jgi:Rrf2 family protein